MIGIKHLRLALRSRVAQSNRQTPDRKMMWRRLISAANLWVGGNGAVGDVD